MTLYVQHLSEKKGPEVIRALCCVVINCSPLRNVLFARDHASEYWSVNARLRLSPIRWAQEDAHQGALESFSSQLGVFETLASCERMQTRSQLCQSQRAQSPQKNLLFGHKSRLKMGK